MVQYKIIDNFLSDSDFIELRQNITPQVAEESNRVPTFSWVYGNNQVTADEPVHFKKVTDIEQLDPLHQWFFGHLIYFKTYQSQEIHNFGALVSKIEPLALWRIQANFTVQQEQKRRGKFHIDYDAEPLKQQSMITSIFYVNTTNGPTILEDGTEIECRANRLVSYPYTTYHAGVLCTDQPYRIVINLNYFKDLEF